MVDSEFGIDSVGGSGLSLAGFLVGTDLDGILGAEKKFLYLIAAKMGEVTGQKKSVV